MNQSIRLLEDLLGQALAIDSFVRLNSHQPLIPFEQVREPETLPRSRQIHGLRGRQFSRPELNVQESDRGLEGVAEIQDGQKFCSVQRLYERKTHCISKETYTVYRETCQNSTVL
jgi:hypothetical protein